MQKDSIDVLRREKPVLQIRLQNCFIFFITLLILFEVLKVEHFGQLYECLCVYLDTFVYLFRKINSLDGVKKVTKWYVYGMSINKSIACFLLTKYTIICIVYDSTERSATIFKSSSSSYIHFIVGSYISLKI